MHAFKRSAYRGHTSSVFSLRQVYVHSNGAWHSSRPHKVYNETLEVFRGLPSLWCVTLFWRVLGQKEKKQKNKKKKMASHYRIVWALSYLYIFHAPWLSCYYTITLYKVRRTVNYNNEIMVTSYILRIKKVQETHRWNHSGALWSRRDSSKRYKNHTRGSLSPPATT